MKNCRSHLLEIILLMILFSISSNAQPICGFDKLHVQLLKSDPNYAASIDVNEEKIRKYIILHPQKVQTTKTSLTTLYTIPIVIHVMHTGGSIGSIYNPSKTQLLSAIEYLNEVYNGSYPGTIGAGDIQIKFELAKRDPNSACTDGIDRVDASSLPGYVLKGIDSNPNNGNNGCPELTLKNFARWEPADYYNLWIVNKIDDKDGTIPGQQFTAGFAWPPGVISSLDGLVMLATQMKPGEKTLPHEIGHALNLYHTFYPSTNYDDCPSNIFCSLFGDRVCDTDPVTENAINGVINFECRTGTNPCTNTPYSENTESNYMAYTNCHNLFTSGQKDRMLAAMSLSSRESLVRNDNLALKSPKADLTVSNPQLSPHSVAPGNIVTVYFAEDNNGSLHANPNYVNFHLSSDNILTPGMNGDIYLDQYFVNQTLPPFSQTNVLSKQITIPSSVAPGTYYLFFAADGTNIINECIEDNNFNTAIITVTGACPDLTIINSTISPTAALAGSNVTVYFKEDNSGDINAGPNYVNFHLSSDDVLTPGLNGDIYLDQYFVSQTVAPHSQTALLNKQLTIPSNITPGTYYLFFAADGTGVINECDNTNNFATAIISISDPEGSAQALYRYWFDNQFANAVSLNVANSTNYYLQNSISTNILQPGLHVFNINFKDVNNKWSSIVSSFFYKFNNTPPVGTPRYEYWFDNMSATRIVKNISSTPGLLLLDNLNTNTLNTGLHTFNIRFKPDGKHWSSISSAFFYKMPALPTGVPKYQYWFDDKTQDSVTNVLTSTNNLILFDSLMNTSGVGLHTLNIRFKPDGGLWSSVSSSFFYKNPVTDINNNTIARCVYWYDNNWQNPNLVYYSGQQNLSSIINTDATVLSAGMHRVSMMFRDERGTWSSVVSDSFNRAAVTTPVCPFNNKLFVNQAFLSNNAGRQWQVNTGTGFVNLANGTNYAGVNSDSLQIINAPTSWYGYQYRCILSDGNASVNSTTYTLKFFLIWNGGSDTGWENPANWSCNTLPDGNVDVFVNSGVLHFPEVNTTGTCRSLTASPGVNVTIKNGAALNITH